MRNLQIIMIGDVVGEPGLEVLERCLPPLIREVSADFVMVNGENVFGGFGITAPLLERLFASGADVVSGGNHIWEQREFWPVLEAESRVLRPHNYPEGSPGKGWVKMEKQSSDGLPLSYLAVNLQGRELMKPLDCPFKSFDSLEEHLKDAVVLVDFHAESTREKEALGFYLDGRASIVAGTHTHVQTADERILSKGTAYITDLGMSGILSGVIGMDSKICLDRARNQVLYRMEIAAPAEGGKTAIQGIIAEIDSTSKKAVSIRRI